MRELRKQKMKEFDIDSITTNEAIDLFSYHEKRGISFDPTNYYYIRKWIVDYRIQRTGPNYAEEND